MSNEQFEGRKPPFVRIEPPYETKRFAQQHGSKNLRMYAREMNGLITTVMFSRDPSGPDGQYEDHLSVGGRDSAGLPRFPTDDEVSDAMNFIGWTIGRYTVSPGNGSTRHVYKAKP